MIQSGTDIHLGDTVLRLLPAEEPLEVEPWPEERFGELLGRSLVMRELFAMMDRLSRSDAPVLLHGETGTGKDLVAQELHQRSARGKGPFVVVDCGSIPENLIESELFGHRRGAFTGALESREGAFTAANGGTIFLDEVGELPLSLQPRFLRVLESGQVRPVGSDAHQKVDVRVIAASHKELPTLVDQGLFRADLYYRMAVVCLRLLPLRQRTEDIPLLVEHLLAKLGLPDCGPLEGANMDRLCTFSWPGNVRELRNVLERAVAFVAVPLEQARFADLSLSLGHLPNKCLFIPINYSIPYVDARQSLITQFEYRYIHGLMKQCKGNVAEAAKTSGLSRKSVYEILKRHGLDR